MMIIAPNVNIPDEEVELHAVRAQGAGGQNVNKLATAIHLRFDIKASSLPDAYKARLLNSSDRRISKDGVVNIKAQQYRSQEQNRHAALQRLAELISSIMHTPKHRIPTKMPRSVKLQRLANKAHRSQTKSLRGKIHSRDE